MENLRKLHTLARKTTLGNAFKTAGVALGLGVAVLVLSVKTVAPE